MDDQYKWLGQVCWPASGIGFQCSSFNFEQANKTPRLGTDAGDQGSPLFLKASTP